MSDEHRKLTPVGFAPFEEPRDTIQSALPPEEEEPQGLSERPSIDDLSTAMAKLESDLETQAENTRKALEQNAAATKESVNAFLNTVLKRFDEGNKRMDAHAKAIRSNTAELKEHREALGLPPVEPPTDDL